MPGINFKSVPILDDISPDSFKHGFLHTKKPEPVILRSFSRDWPAQQLWTYDYFKRHCGDVEVPLYSEEMATSSSNYMAAQEKMRFADYLNLMQQGPTLKRMFLFNIFDHMPKLYHDFNFPDLATSFLKKYPFMFFGGETAYVDIHYDLDLSHVFLTQFQGTKKVYLFAPEYSRHLYQHPLTVSSNVDFRNPDFERYPLLQDLQGYECTLSQGDTLFIPSCFWHYVYYLEAGYSLSLRARPHALSRRLYSFIKIFNLTVMDRLLARGLSPEKWYQAKERMAQKRADKLMCDR